jgi:hypothetical protein
MAIKFFYQSPDGLEHGPAELAEMKMRIENGSISVLTMVRVDGSRTWCYANDVPELDEYFRPAAALPGSDIGSKPLKELRVDDLPTVFVYFAGKAAPWVALLIYVPFALQAVGVIVTMLASDNMLRRSTGQSMVLGPGNMLVPMVAMIWQATVPLALLIAYWKKVLTLGQFIVAQTIAYACCTVALWIWEYQTGMALAELVKRIWTVPGLR